MYMLPLDETIQRVLDEIIFLNFCFCVRTTCYFLYYSSTYFNFDAHNVFIAIFITI